MESFKYYLLPIFKVILFGFFIWLCFMPFALIAEINFIDLSFMPPVIMEIMVQIAGVLMVLGALLMIFRIFNQYNFELIFIGREGMWTGFVKGTLIGSAWVTAITFIAWLNGNVAFTFASTNIGVMIGYLILYILVGIMEEFIFRTFPLVALAERYKLFTAIFLTSILFGFAHYFNPGFNWIAMLNISLVGVVLGIIVLLKRNIHWAIGIHFGWNYTQGVLLGYNVSGTNTQGILVAKPVGPIYLSGGQFGIESSIFCTILSIVVIIYLLVRHRLVPLPEIILEEELEEEVI